MKTDKSKAVAIGAGIALGATQVGQYFKPDTTTYDQIQEIISEQLDPLYQQRLDDMDVYLEDEVVYAFQETESKPKEIIKEKVVKVFQNKANDPVPNHTIDVWNQIYDASPAQTRQCMGGKFSQKSKLKHVAQGIGSLAKCVTAQQQQGMSARDVYLQRLNGG